MRLSDVKGERVFDVIAALIDPIANIAGDEKAVELLKREKVPEGTTPRAFMLDRLRRCVPALLTTHKADFVTMLAAIEGVSAASYIEGLDMGKLVHDVYDLLTDEAFTSLFTSAQSEISSGSAPVSIGEA